MAHAPIILPAVLRRPLPYHRVLWAPAARLQASLLVRIGVGDARPLTGGWRLGGVLAVVAVLLFIGLAARLVVGRAARAAHSHFNGSPMTAPRVSLPGQAHRGVDGVPHRSPATGAAGRSGRNRWYLIGEVLVAGWLVGELAVAVANSYVSRARWLLVHMLLLGGASTAVLIWSEHFAMALLHRADGGNGRSRALRLGAFTAGAAPTSPAAVRSGNPGAAGGGARHQPRNVPPTVPTER